MTSTLKTSRLKIEGMCVTLGSGGDSTAEASLCWHGMRGNLAGPHSVHVARAHLAAVFQAVYPHLVHCGHLGIRKSLPNPSI